MPDEIVVKYVADVNGFKAEMKSTQDAIKATATEADIAGASTTEAFAKTEKSTQSLRTQLKNLKAELAVATDPKDVERLARAAGDITDKLDDATQAAKIFASESKFEQIRTALGGIGRSIASLDFKQAASQAKLLQSAVASLTFKEALGGLKNLGSTFLSIGKTLLVNPIFLIAAAITAAGVAVVALKDKVPFLTKAFDAVGEAVKKVKNFVTGITDGLGLTTFATDKAFDRLIALGKEVDEQRDRRLKYEKEAADKAKETADKIIAEQKRIRAEEEQGAYDSSVARNKVREDQFNRLLEAAKKEKEFDAKRREEKKKQDIQDEEDLLKLTEEGFNARAKLYLEDAEKKKKDREEADEAARQAFSDFGNALFERQKQIDEERLRSQQNADEERLKSQIETDSERLKNFKGTEEEKAAFAKEIAEQQDRLKQQLDDRRDLLAKTLALEQAKRDKAQALFNIAIQTAVNIIKAGPNIPLAVAMGVIGAIQAGVVLSKPLPKFAKGTERVTGGIKGKDSVHAILMPDEAVIRANENMARPGLAKAWNEGRLDEFIFKNYVTPKLSDLLGQKEQGLAENINTSSKLNFPDEYALARVMKRNKGVEIENADYLANKIAKSINSRVTKRGWA